MPPKTQRQGTEAGFVTYYLTRQQRHDAVNQQNEFEDAIEVYERLALAGYYVTTNFDERSGAMRVAVSMYNKDHINYNLTLTEYNANLDHALLELWYFHSIICSNERWLDFASGFTPRQKRKE